MNKIDKFVKEINKKIKPAKIVKGDKYVDGVETFELKLIPTVYFKDYGMLAKTDAYYSLIENTVLKYFNLPTSFNNTRDIFWFILDNTK